VYELSIGTKIVISLNLVNLCSNT